MKRHAIEPLLLSKRDAATCLNICVRKLSDLIKDGDLPSLRIGSRVLIPRRALIAFTNRRDHVRGPAAEGRSTNEN